MKFLADHNVEAPIIRALREARHDVVSVAVRDAALRDDEVLQWSEQDERILITNDKDFGELIFLQELASVGILLVRLPGATSREKAERLLEEIDAFGERLLGAITVVSPEATRRRPLRREWR